jgi:hypothetical protein
MLMNVVTSAVVGKGMDAYWQARRVVEGVSVSHV